MNITQLEFPDSNPSEIKHFVNKILPYFKETSSHVKTYDKTVNGHTEKMMIAISPMFIPLGATG